MTISKTFAQEFPATCCVTLIQTIHG